MDSNADESLLIEELVRVVVAGYRNQALLRMSDVDRRLAVIMSALPDLPR